MSRQDDLRLYRWFAYARRRLTRTRSAIVIAAILTAAMVAVIYGSSATAAFPGGAGRIAFVSDGGVLNHADIYTVNPDGTDVRRLTNLGSDKASSPAVSPDGSKIAYSVDETEIWTVNSDGSNPTHLQTGPVPYNPGGLISARHPAWSPDGTKIVFESNSNDEEGYTIGVRLWIMAAAGGSTRQLTSGPSNGDYGAVWSPTGNRIAFYASSGGRNRIYTIDANSTPGAGTDSRVQVTQPTPVSLNDQNPSWSPDGGRLAFDRGTTGSGNTDGTRELLAVNMSSDGSAATAPVQLTGNSNFDGNPAWSPDGTRIAFESTFNGHRQIFALSPDTPMAPGTLVMDTEHQFNDEQPDWGTSPATITPPTISGTARVGEALTEGHGTWANNPTSFRHEWHRCNSAGNGCSPIAGATSQTYTLTPADQGSTIRVMEWATGAGGTGGPARSAPTAVVTAQSTTTTTMTTATTTQTTTTGTTTTPTQIPGCPKTLRFGIAEVQYVKPDVAGNCFMLDKDKQYSSVPGQPILINGIRLSAKASSGYFRFDTAKNKITGAGPADGLMPIDIGVMWGSVVVPIDTAPLGVYWDVSKAYTHTTYMGLLFKGMGLPLRFDDIKLVQYGANIAARLELPETLAKLMGAKWATGASADITVHSDNPHGLSVTGVVAKWPKVPLGALDLNNLFLTWDRLSQTWTGGAELAFTTGLKIKADVKFVAGEFHSGHASVDFPDPGQPVFSGVNLTKATLSLVVKPRLMMDGTVTLAAGGKIFGQTVAGVRGAIGMYFANASNPLDMTVVGNGRVLHLTSPGFYLSGEALFVEKVNIANAYTFYVYPSILGVGGQISITVPWVFTASGNAEITADVVKRQFNADANAKIQVGLASADGSMVISNKGAAGCITVLGWKTGGAVTWDGRTTVWGGSCDLGSYRVKIARARGAAAPPSFTVSGTAPFTGVEVQGTGGAPDITLSGPAGQQIVPTGALYVDRARGVVILRSPGRNSTFIAMDKRLAGRWSVVTNSGSPAIARLLVADGLPQPRVTAHVAGTGRTRTLAYTVDAGSGQRVSFFESGPQSYRLIGSTTARSGKIRFTIADGPAGPRSVIAQITNGTTPRTSLTVARFVAPPMPKLSAPAHLTVRRAGETLAIAWGSVHGARHYAVKVDVADGTRLLRVVSQTTRSLRIPRIASTSAATVRVSALDELNAFGPAAQARLRAQPRPSLSRLAVTPSRFKATRPPTVSYRVSAAGKVTFLLTRLTTGRRLGTGCVPATSQLKSKPACKGWLPFGASLTRASRAGANSFRLDKRAAGATLSSGNYRLVAQLSGAGSRQAIATFTFTVTK